MLENNECSSWYNEVDIFKVSVWGRRTQLMHVDRSACMARQKNPTPECIVNGTECYNS